MRAYVIRRLLLMVPTLLILSALVFLSVRFIPGDIIDALESRMDYLAAPLDREQLERVLGLDVPIHVQYVRWVGDILVRGTLGDSLLGKDTVEAKIRLRAGPTFQLGLMALVIAMVIALPVGIFSAIRQDTAGDYAGRTVAVLGLATPNFWLALMVIIYPALWWDWSPPIILVRFLDNPWESLGVFIIPSIILGTALSAGTMRITRTMMLEVLRQDYVQHLRRDPGALRHPRGQRQGPPAGASAAHLLGTDHLGRDLLTRIIYGARLSLAVGLAATALNVLVALLLGGVSGFIGGKLDLVTQRFVDAWMAFPGLLLLLTIMSIVGRGLPQIIVTLGVSGGIVGSRVVRGAVIGVRENMYFQAAQTVGSPTVRTILRHVVPNIAPVLVVIFSINIGGVIISEASLSFLGFGLPIEIPSWGGLLSREGRRYMEQAPHLALWPGLALTITVYCLNNFGDAVRDLLDPRLRGGTGRYDVGDRRPRTAGHAAAEK